MDRYVPETLPFSKKRLPLRVIISYLFDYGIIVYGLSFLLNAEILLIRVVLRVLAVLYALIDKVVTPFRQHFSLKNYTIQYPYAVKERIPIPYALVICVLFPMFVIAIYTMVIDGLFSHRRKVTGTGWSNIYRLKDRLWELNCGILGIFLAEGAAFVITGSLKNLCGKPRPDLIDRCRPKEGSVDPPVFGLSNSSICTQTDQAIMTDGFRSFPSGHSSAAFAGLFYLSLYLAGKLHVLDNRGEVWRTTIVLIPTLAAACVAMSRIMDARHHPFDVLFGSAMGILVAWASYRQYFPPVSETWRKGRAYPIRTWGTETKGPAANPMLGDNNPQLLRQDSDMDGYRANMASASGVSAASTGAPQGTNLGAGGNVFRDQISRSQRQRGGGARGGDGSGPYARDDDWSVSSSDDLGHSGVDQGFEMQRPRYTPGSGASPAPNPNYGVAAGGGVGAGAGMPGREGDVERSGGGEAVRHAPPIPSVRVEDQDTEYKGMPGGRI